MTDWSSTLVHVENDVEVVQPDLGTMTLEDLGKYATSEHRAVENAAERADGMLSLGLLHAIRSGMALLVAKEKVPFGTWREWLLVNTDIAPGTAEFYQRWARHREVILASDRPLTTKNVRHFLLGLPAVHPSGKKQRDEMTREAKRLKKAGLTLTEIGDLLGVDRKTVRGWLDPAAYARNLASDRRRNQRRAAGAKALREQERRSERDALAKATGGIVEKAYGLIRETGIALDKALSSSEPGMREKLLQARRHTDNAEESVVAAMQEGRRS